ncbi:MAG: hypothetical protein KDD39_04870 [Bdellovibrionales bacterium]|nr:hypothetical protein [Bdellovibrionales bacterium]
MTLYHYLPIAVIAGAAALYHASSKNLGGALGANPWAVLALTYLLSALVSFVLFWFWPAGEGVKGAEWRSVLPGAMLLGLACVGIEGGYLLAYRFGWDITQLFSITSVVNTMAIFAVGLVLFKEHLTPSALVGLSFVITGIGLVHWR